MTKLLNDCFDLLNSRFHKEEISKTAWVDSNGEAAYKKKKLQIFLHVLDTTEQIANDPNRDSKLIPDTIFMSQTTLEAWRLVIHSSIGLIDELFEAKFEVVLTGRFNQDPIEVIRNFLCCIILK